MKKSKLPKGYRVTVYSVKEKNWPAPMYDCRVWHDGSVVIRTSSTLFDYRIDAYNYGIELAEIHAGIRKDH